MNKIIGFLCCFISVACMAQERDLASAQFTTYRLNQGDTVAGVKQVELRFNIPAARIGQDPLVVSFGYADIGIKDLLSVGSKNLESLNITAAVLHRISPDKQFTFFVQTGIFSDFVDLSGKDVRTSAGVRYLVSTSATYKHGFGLAYARQFFGNQLVPFFEMEWHINPKLRLYGQLPVRPKLDYQLSNKWSVGTGIEGAAASFRLSAGPDSNRFIRTTQWGGYFTVKRQLGKYFSANVNIGRYFRNTIKLYNDTDRSGWTLLTIPLGSRPEPVKEIESKSLFIQAGISYDLF